MNIRLVGISCVFVGAVALLIYMNSRHLPRREPYQGYSTTPYPVTCTECGEKYTLTAAQLQKMNNNGESQFTQYEVRRYKCRKCGKFSVVSNQWSNDEDNPNIKLLKESQSPQP